MNSFQAVGKGLDLTRRLWPAIFAYLLVFSSFGAAATILLPFQVVNGQVSVPAPANPADAVSRLVIALGIYFGLIAFSVWLLGGVLAGCKEILEKRVFPAGELFRAGAARVGALFTWAMAFIAVCILAGISAASVLGFIAAATGQAQAMSSMAAAGFSTAALGFGLFLLYSPAAIVDDSIGVWIGFRESFQFVKRHGAQTMLLVFLVSLIGALVWWFGVLVLARAVGAIRESMGVPPFAAGWPVFFFGLVNGLPQAFLSVFIPASLYAYYHGSKE